jgi:hypothetical protein
MTNNVSATVLENEVLKAMERDPQLPDEDIYKKLIKKLVTASVVGSPAYHRGCLEDLKTIVDAKGIPHLFVTLTADEATQLKWQEVRDMEAFLQGWMEGGDWQDMPVENAFLFHTRTTEFMSRYVTAEDGGIFGKVNHWLIRYESQVRGGGGSVWYFADAEKAMQHSCTARQHACGLCQQTH